MKLKEFRLLIIIFLVGVVLTYIGALLKIIHFEIGFITGNLILTVATGIKVLAVILAIFKLIAKYRNQD